MKRVMFEYDMFGGFVEIREKRFLHPEADELWTDHGEVPDDVWARYEAAVKELGDAHKALHSSLAPLSISPEEAEEARLAHEAHKAEEEAMMEGFRKEREEKMAECPHEDEYGSLFQEGACMVCGKREP